MCHLFADTKDELLNMAKMIGINAKYIQHEDRPKMHFDVCEAKRKLAVKYGAIEITNKKVSALIRLRSNKEV